MNSISIMLVDDNQTFLKVVWLFLAQYEPRLEVVGAASSGADGLHLARNLEPDVILLDMFLPDENGLEMLPKLRAALPQSKIIVLSLHPLKSYRNALIAAGASACLSKETLYTQLIPTIYSSLDPSSPADPSTAVDPKKPTTDRDSL